MAGIAGQNGRISSPKNQYTRPAGVGPSLDPLPPVSASSQQSSPPQILPGVSSYVELQPVANPSPPLGPGAASSLVSPKLQPSPSFYGDTTPQPPSPVPQQYGAVVSPPYSDPIASPSQSDARPSSGTSVSHSPFAAEQSSLVGQAFCEIRINEILIQLRYLKIDTIPEKLLLELANLLKNYQGNISEKLNIVFPLGANLDITEITVTTVGEVLARLLPRELSELLEAHAPEMVEILTAHDEIYRTLTERLAENNPQLLIGLLERYGNDPKWEKVWISLAKGNPELLIELLEQPSDDLKSKKAGEFLARYNSDALLLFYLPQRSGLNWKEAKGIKIGEILAKYNPSILVDLLFCHLNDSNWNSGWIILARNNPPVLIELLKQHPEISSQILKIPEVAQTLAKYQVHEALNKFPNTKEELEKLLSLIQRYLQDSKMDQNEILDLLRWYPAQRRVILAIQDAEGHTIQQLLPSSIVAQFLKPLETHSKERDVYQSRSLWEIDYDR